MKKSTTSAKQAARASALDTADAKKGKLYLVSNAHLDTQWNWTIRDTIRECLKATLDDNFALLEKYPAYRMNFEGAFRYRLMKEYYPEKYEKMKDYIAKGRWNVAGSTWDAMDVNVPSSEALMRQVLLGNGYFEREFGKKSADIFLTDCFGFRYALPSIAAHMGLSGFSTQKLVWGAGSPILHTDGSTSAPLPGGSNVRMDLGKWVGPDGNGVFVSLLEGNYTYNFENDGDTPIERREEYLRAIEHNARYAGAAKRSMYYGTGDYGGACKESSARMVQAAVDANGTDGSLFEVVSASTDQIFRELTKEEKAALPVYDGHLLIPHGYGAMTSHTASKRFNRKGELLADAAERLSMLATLKTGRAYPASRLRGAWELLLWHQFHDDLPGTSIGEAYEFSHNDYAIALNLFATELTAAAGALLSRMDTAVEGRPIALFNPLNVSRQDPVTVTLPADGLPVHPAVLLDGEVLPADLRLSPDGKTAELTFVPSLPPLSMTVAALTEGDGEVSPLSAGENFLENAYLRVEVDENGDISRIYDKENGREVLSAPIQLTISPDNNTVWPSWELKYEDLFLPAEPVGGTPEITVCPGKAETKITVTRRRGESSFTQTLLLGRESRRLDVRCMVDWYEKESLLRAVFPLAVENETALFDQGLGAAKGDNTTSHPYFQHNVHQWASLTDRAGDYGVAILNDCKYGMEKPSDGSLSLTLIHTPKGEYSHRSGQNFQDMGRNEFTFSIYPYAVRESGSAGVPEQAARLNQSVLPFAMDAHPGKERQISLLGSTEDGILVRCVKQEEKGDRLILRVQECDGRARERVTLPLGFAVTAAEEINGYEERIGDAVIEDGALIFPLGRYGVKTFAISCPAETSAQPVYTPLRYAPLVNPFNRKVTSQKESPEGGELIPGSGISIPEELFPETVLCGGVPFWMGAAQTANAISCAGQTVQIPEGSERLYLLCTSTAGDRDASFLVDGKPVTVTVPDVRENVGSWDQVVRGRRPLIKRQEIGYVFSHLHDSHGEETVLPYDFAYLFKFTLPGGSVLTLPEDESILLFAATASKGDCIASPLAPLYDIAEKENRPMHRLTAEGFPGGGEYAEGTPVILHGSLLTSDSLFEGFAREDGGEVQRIGRCTGFFKMPDHDLTVRVGLRKLGENLLLRRPCTASGSVSQREAPEKALNGDCESKWCADADEKGECILTVSLEERAKIGGYTVCHCGAFEGGQWNTEDFSVEYRDGDGDWQAADSVRGNREDITIRDFPPVFATEVRLKITKPARTKDTHCRIYQFHVYKAK